MEKESAPNVASSASAVLTSSAVPSLQPRSSRLRRREEAPGMAQGAYCQLESTRPVTC